MKIPSNAIIPEEKLTRYLLAFREYDDKSRFLMQAGFTLGKPDLLLRAIRRLTTENEAIEDGENEYGEFFRVDGDLEGRHGKRLTVTTIWLRWKLDGKIHFVTLKPLR